MKRLLLFLFSVLAAIGVMAGTSTGEQSGNDIIITINDDPGLENFSATSWGQNYGIDFISWVGNGGTIIIKGTSLSPAGLAVIENSLSTKASYKKVALDLTQSNIDGELQNIYTQFTKILFASGTTLPAESILRTGTGLSYAYSADDESKEGIEINLYVGSVTSLDKIEELKDVTLDKNTVVNLTGDINGTIKKALIAKGVSKDNIKTPDVIDKTTCSVTGGSVERDVEMYAYENNIAESDITTTLIRRILVTGGTLTQADIDYIATLNIEILNMAAAQYEDGVTWNFPNSVEQLVMPEGTISHAEFGDLTNCENLIYAVDGGFNRLYLPNHSDAGYFTTDLLEGVPNQIVISVEGVAISGKINTEDFYNVQNTFKNATMFNLHSATLVGENVTIKDFATKITSRGDNIYVDLVAPKGTTADELKTLSDSKCGSIGCSYSVLDDGTFNIYIKDGDRSNLDIAKYESTKTTKAVFVSRATSTDWGYDNPNESINTHVIEALNKTKYIVSVDFSQLPIVDNKDEVLSGLTSSNIKYVRLPYNCEITESTYANTTIEIVSRLTTTERHDARMDDSKETLTVAEIFSNKAGGLASAAEYKNMDVDGANIMRLKGSINEADLAGLNTENRYMDFTELTNAPTDFSNLTQGKVEYIALPAGVAIPEGIAASKGVGSFNTETGAFTFLSKEEGSVLNVLWMMDDLITAENKITSLVMSGPLNAFDITTYPSNLELKKDGHFAKSVEEGVATITGGALSGNVDNIVSADFKNATFYENINIEMEIEESDMVFSAAGAFSNVTSLVLPTSEKQILIPDNCMYNLKEITGTLCIPGNYQIIGEKALCLCTKITQITTTSNDKDAITENGEYTITLPASLTEIRTQAFGGIEKMTDVYILATTAPKCAGGAFDPTMTYGDNGFAGDNAHPICRDNYQDEGRDVIAILHYPHECEKNGENVNYTDITRMYTLYDETGATDSYGNTLMWPKHVEFGRSYQQALHGYIWNDWENYTSENSYTLIDNPTKYKTEYQGWHEFVLANNYNTIEYDPQAYFEEQEIGFVKKDWYTLCVPYDLTKSQLLQVMGVNKENTIHTDNETKEKATKDLYPDVRTLTHVSRSIDTGKVTLHLSKNLVDGGQNGTALEVKLGENGQGFGYNALEGDDPVIMKGGHPYLVRPYIPNTDLIKSVGKYVMAVAEDCGYTIGEYKFANQYLLPTVDWQIHAVNADKSTEDKAVYVYEDENKAKPCYYHFIGTYEPGYIPQYAYFLGEHKDTKAHQFFRTDKEGLTWSQYSAVIIGLSSLDYEVPEGESNIYLDVTNGNDLVVLAGETDDPAQVGKSMSLVFDDSGETTAIQGILAVDNDVTVGSGKVYNLNGQYVGAFANNLPKGVYIKDGKKFVVK